MRSAEGPERAEGLGPSVFGTDQAMEERSRQWRSPKYFPPQTPPKTKSRVPCKVPVWPWRAEGAPPELGPWYHVRLTVSSACRSLKCLFCPLPPK